MVRFCESPWGPQSSPWSFASVATVIVALLSAVMADGRRVEDVRLGLGFGTGAVGHAVSRLTMRSWVPGEELRDRRRRGRWRDLWPGWFPTAPAKCTSPPKPNGDRLAVPFQSGLRGECCGNDFTAATSWARRASGRWRLARPPPEKNARVDRAGAGTRCRPSRTVAADGGPCVRPRRHYVTRCWRIPGSADRRTG